MVNDIIIGNDNHDVTNFIDVKAVMLNENTCTYSVFTSKEGGVA